MTTIKFIRLESSKHPGSIRRIIVSFVYDLSNSIQLVNSKTGIVYIRSKCLLSGSAREYFSVTEPPVEGFSISPKAHEVIKLDNIMIRRVIQDDL